MNKKNLAGLAVLALATSAWAGGPELAPVVNSGFYLSGNWGLTFLASADPYYTTGWGAGAALGYRFNHFRVEAEGEYLTHMPRGQLQSLSFSGLGLVGLNRLEIETALANIYYDFNLNSNFVPYIGAGLGVAHTWSGVTVLNSAGATLLTQNYSQNSFAYQGVVGVDYKIGQNIRFGVSYHALGWSGHSNLAYLINANNRVANTNDVTLSRGFFNNSNFENKVNLEVAYFF